MTSSVMVFGPSGDVSLNSAALKAILGQTNPIGPSLATVGAGTIAASLMAGSVTARTGAQASDFSDVTDTAANILSAFLNAAGGSLEWTYVNNTAWTATLSGGSGVSMSGQTIVPANSWVRYLIQTTGPSTVTLTAIESGSFATKGTVVANGSTAVVVNTSAITKESVVSFGLNTVGGTPAGAPFLSAVTPGTSFSVKAVAGDTSTYNWEIRG